MSTTQTTNSPFYAAGLTEVTGHVFNAAMEGQNVYSVDVSNYHTDWFDGATGELVGRVSLSPVSYSRDIYLARV